MKKIENYRYVLIPLDEQMEKISVIMPAYNVQKWISNAIESVLSQTYRNLEIILVDDASEDDTAKICDQYAAKDERIHVIHKTVRGGVGAARNTGVNLASGDYLSFVDSDDWIENNMYEAMLSAIHQTGSDMAICRHKKVYFESVKDESTENAVLFEGEELIENYVLTCEGIRGTEMLLFGAVWNKLFERSMIQDIRFQDGVHEDMQISFRLMAKSKKAIYLDQGYYNYRIDRDGSLMKLNTPIERWGLFIKRRSEISSYLRTVGREDLAVAWDYYSCFYMLDYYRIAYRQSGSAKNSVDIRQDLSNGMRQLLTKELRKKVIPVGSKKEHLQLKIFLTSPKLFLFITEYKIMLKRLYKK